MSKLRRRSFWRFLFPLRLFLGPGLLRDLPHDLGIPGFSLSLLLAALAPDLCHVLADQGCFAAAGFLCHG